MKLFTDEMMNIPIDEIQPNKINPNKMADSTFKQLKLSLKKFGQLNPIIVREMDKGYEIIDGEWRYRASKAIGWREVQAKVIEATDEEVKGLILASTIKGKHDAYVSADIIEGLSKTETSESLSAMGLDKNKIERKIKYHGSDKIQVVQKKGASIGKHSRDEIDTANVKPLSAYKRLIPLADAPKHCKIEDGKVVLK